MTAAPNFLIPKLTVEVAEDPSHSLCATLTQWMKHSALSISMAHDPRWLAVMRDGLGHKPYLLIARQRDDIRGYLPLALVRSRRGLQLVSLPFLRQAGPVAMDMAADQALIDEAIRLTQCVGARFLELRPQQPLTHGRLHNIAGKQIFPITLKADPEFHWQTLSPTLRKSIRRGEQQGLTAAWGGRELLDQFYDVYAVRTQPRWPRHAREFFAQLLWRFDRDAEAAIIRRDDRVVAAGVLLHDSLTSQPTTHIIASGMLRLIDGRQHVQAWMYHRFMERAIARGGKQFDFGPPGTAPPTPWQVRGQTMQRQYYLANGADALPRHHGHKRRIPLWFKRWLKSS